MEIIVGDVSSTITDPRKNFKALSIIRDICRARPKGFQYMPKFRKGMWDGYISLMYSFSKFPTGLLPSVVEALENYGYSISIRHNGSLPYKEVTPDFLRDITLRGYQVEAANVLLESGRGIAKMATNSGKTEVMAAIIKSLGVETLVIVHRKELMYQTMERFSNRLGVQVGIIGDGKRQPDKITVAMIQTLWNNRDVEEFYFKSNKLLMVDECHHASSDQMLNILKTIPGPYRFGFSGTPLKRDLLSDMKLIGATGDVLVEVTNDYLIRIGYSAKPIVKIATVEDPSQELWELDYQSAYDQLIVNNKIRNYKIVEMVNESSGTILILVTRLEHGRILESLIPGSLFVHGSDSTEYRRSILDSMRNGAGGVYISSPIFDEGVDVPSLDVVVIAGGGKSQIKLLQRIGRGLRKKSGDNILTVYDFIDDTNKYLLQASNDRVDTYVEESFETVLI